MRNETHRKTVGVMQKESQDIKIEVVAYSGYKANERPMYFVLGMQKIEVKWFWTAGTARNMIISRSLPIMGEYIS